MTKIAINGAAGRMGRRLVDLASQDSELTIVAALESASHRQLGTDAGQIAGARPLGIPLSTEMPESVEVVIDFSNPAGADAILDRCLASKVGLVMATTGLSENTVAKLESESHQIPIVWAPNMSLAVNLTMKLAETAGRALMNHSAGVDVEIIERHHRFKEDAPSGTAIKFGQLIAAAMGQNRHQHGREGMVGKRALDEIGYHAVRAGDDPGQHTIIFGMLGETIELRVAASNRDCYAMGALAAAKFLVRQRPGLYSMYDVLGL
jgi:4-hydroxy-tetrahydrodipicolinate reductase